MVEISYGDREISGKERRTIGSGILTLCTVLYCSVEKVIGTGSNCAFYGRMRAGQGHSQVFVDGTQ